MIDTYPVPLSVDELMAKAREITSINIIDSDVIEPFSVFLHSLNNEGMLSKQGAQDIVPFLLRMLANRLRMQRDFAQHPEIAEQKITAPIFLWGAMRTGSTKTQKMLAASGDFNFLPFWQSLNPCLHSGDRSESPQARIDDSDQFTQWLGSVSPKMKFIHEMRSHEPDEETFFLINSFMTSSLMGVVKIPSFLQWLMTQDLTAQFEYLRDTLKYLQWQGLADPNKRWVLKSPFYYGLESLLLKVFPDASLVMTHRHPADTFPSTCSMLENMHLPYSSATVNFNELLMMISMGLEQHIAVRAANPDINILDIDFKEITQSIEPLMQKIYVFCKQPLSDSSMARIHAWDNNNPMHKKGTHKYTLEQFGVQPEDIEQKFSAYIHLLDSTFRATQ